MVRQHDGKQFFSCFAVCVMTSLSLLHGTYRLYRTPWHSKLAGNHFYLYLYTLDMIECE
jgi:hypothetical protein